MPYNAGDAYLQILPSFRGVVEQITREARGWGTVAGREFSSTFNGEVRRGTNNAPLGPSPADTARQGQAAGRRFSESFRAAVDAALATLPDVEINGDTSEVDRKLAALRERLTALSDAEIGVDLDSGEATRELAKIRAELAAVSKEHPDIGVRVDIARATAALAELQAEIAAINGEKTEVKVDTTGARRQVSALAVAILLLGPAATTAGAVSVGAIAGIIPSLGAAVLAVLGLKDAFKSGTIEGTHFGDQVKGLQGEFATLKATAAAGILPGLSDALTGLDPLFRPLNAAVGTFSTQIGGIVATLAPALVQILVDLQPLFTTLGNVIQDGANHLASWAENGDGVKGFVTFVEANLPVVLQTLGTLAQTVVHVVEALAPIGRVVLTGLGILAGIINAIPVNVLTGLASVLIVVYTAFKLLVVVPAIIRAINIALEATPVGVILTVIAALAAFTLGFSSNAGSAADAKAAVDSYADSVQKSTDAMSRANQQQTLKNLSDRGALELLDALHGQNLLTATSYDDLTKAVNGSDAQFKTVTDSLRKVFEAGGTNGAAAGGLLVALQQLRDGLQGQIDKTDAYNAANDQLSTKLRDQHDVLVRNADMLGVTTDQYSRAAEAARKNTQQTRDQAIAFQLANDGGSLLALTLDKLSGKKLSYQQTLNAFQQQLTTGGPRGTAGTPGTPGTGNSAAVASATNRRARAIEAEAIAQTKYNEALAKGNTDQIAAAHLRLARAKDAVTNATNSLNAAEKRGGGTAGTPGVPADTRLKGLSAAAVKNRNDILGLVQSATQAAEAYGKLTGSTEKGRQKLIDLRAQLIENRVKLGENRKDVTAFVDSVLTIPPAIDQANKTALELKTEAAKKKIDDLQGRIDRIKQGKEPHLDANSVEARGVIADLQRQIDGLKGKIPIDLSIDPALKKLNTLTQHIISGGGFVLVGTGKRAEADGGVLDFYANGGVRENHVAQIAPAGSMRVWAEPETGGEAYIPLAAAKRARSQMIARETVARLGGIASFADGGFAQLDLRELGTGRGIRDVHVHQDIHSPLPERASVLGPRGMEQAAYALDNAP